MKHKITQVLDIIIIIIIIRPFQCVEKFDKFIFYNYKINILDCIFFKSQYILYEIVF